jgi:hypothetical protein
MAWLFRKKFFSLFASSSEAQPPVEPTEPITRFLVHSSQFTAAQAAKPRQPPVPARVKAPAISPSLNKETGRLEWSTYRAKELASADLWNICGKHIDNPATGYVPKARGTCAASAFMEWGLSFDADGKPHPRHANVIGWPLTKHELKNIQQKIAPSMVLEIRPL